MLHLIPFFLFGAIMFAKPGQASLTSGVKVDGTKTSNGGIIKDAHILQYNAIEQDVMARTIWGEARNSGYSGMQSVANVIMNRARANKRMWGGSSVSAVCKYPAQFSCWNVGDPNRAKLIAVTKDDKNFKTALEIAAKALSGNLPDITRGATFYLTVAAYKGHQKVGYKSGSSWSYGTQPMASVGGHYFFSNYQVNGVA